MNRNEINLKTFHSIFDKKFSTNGNVKHIEFEFNPPLDIAQIQILAADQSNGIEIKMQIDGSDYTTTLTPYAQFGGYELELKQGNVKSISIDFSEKNTVSDIRFRLFTKPRATFTEKKFHSKIQKKITRFESKHKSTKCHVYDRLNLFKPATKVIISSSESDEMQNADASLGVRSFETMIEDTKIQKPNKINIEIEKDSFFGLKLYFRKSSSSTCPAALKIQNLTSLDVRGPGLYLLRIENKLGPYLVLYSKV